MLLSEIHKSTKEKFDEFEIQTSEIDSRTIIKKIPVTADFNYMIIDNAMSGNDFMDCSRVTMKQLEFRITNEDGKLVNLHGANVSFSLIFDIMDTKA